MGMLDRLRGTPQDRFARRVLTAVRDAGVASARYLPDQFAIEVRRDSAQAQPAIAFLGNIYRECERVDRNERRERIASFLSAVVFNPGAPTSWAEVAPLLRPLLRTATFGTGMPAAAPRPVRRTAWSYLAEFVVVDQPTSVMYVTEKQLADWGVTAGTVFDRARRNMAAIARAEPASPDPAAGSRALVRMVEDGDAYWASHLFVDGWLAAQEPRLGGTPVAFVADTTGILLVGRGAQDPPETLARVFELVEREYREAARPISPMALTVDDTGAVVPFLVEAGHPLYDITHRTEVITAASEYAAQASSLQTDAFVASCTTAQRPDGTVFTLASWAEGVDTLLPRADYVAFPSDDAEPFFVTWAALEREVDLEPEPGLEPARYRLRSWPHPGVVERLRRAATRP